MLRLPLSDSIFKLPFGGDETGRAPSLQPGDNRSRTF